MFTYGLYTAATGFLVYSWLRDKAKTKKALQKAWKAFDNMFPEFTSVLILVSLVVTLLTPEIISRFVGQETGFFGMIFTGILGAVTLIPGFVAFPLASSLLNHGAGLVQISVFISTLMMVGVVTAPLEIKYFGRKQTLLRNGLSFVLAFVVAYGLGVLV